MYHLVVGYYLLGDDLRIDGSNFPGWHLSLRNVQSAMSFPHLGGVLKLGFTSTFVPISQ
jgi:hypothetical protein